MRTFIAIEFEEDIKSHLTEVQNKVVQKSLKGHFTDENNFHLTLRFLGEVSSEDIDSLAMAVEETAERNRCFSLKMSHLGFFPKGNRTIVWAGVDKSDSLLRLFNQLERNLSKQGFPRDRKGLSPHITLGREIMLKERFDDVKEAISLGGKEIFVKSISLMESKRIGAKLVYRPIFVSKLK